MAATLVAMASTVGASITVVAHYQLGEADAGAVSGGTGADPTVDSVGALNLTRTGAPTYSSSVATQTRTSSTLSMLHNGTTDRYSAAGVPTAVTDNFGIEAWVRSDGSVAGNALIAYVGNTSNSGWGIFRVGGSYTFLYGGVAIGSGAAITTEWTHLALVRAGGVTQLYVNGQSTGTSASVPNVPAGNTMIGGNPSLATEFFDGRIDDVRVFTFNPGEFTTLDLNFIAPAIPANSPVGLAMLVALIAFAGFFMLGRIS